MMTCMQFNILGLNKLLFKEKFWKMSENEQIIAKSNINNPVE